MEVTDQAAGTAGTRRVRRTEPRNGGDGEDPEFMTHDYWQPR